MSTDPTTTHTTAVSLIVDAMLRRGLKVALANSTSNRDASSSLAAALPSAIVTYDAAMSRAGYTQPGSFTQQAGLMCIMASDRNVDNPNHKDMQALLDLLATSLRD